MQISVCQLFLNKVVYTHTDTHAELTKVKKGLISILKFQRPFVIVQFLSHVQLLRAPWPAARLSPLSSTVSQSVLKFMSMESLVLSNHLILCCPLLLLPSIFSSIRVFSSESALHIRWPKYWSFSFSISSFNEYSGLISFRMDWFDLLIVLGTLKSLPQHHNQNHQFFEVQPSF